MFQYILVAVFQAAIMFSIPWSIGGVLDSDSREKFDAFYREVLLGKDEENPIPKNIGKIEIPFPDKDFVYDYMYEVGDLLRGKFAQICVCSIS